MKTIFEKIIDKEIPASIIYEDDVVISFLDINPTNKGQALIIPKKKFVNIFDIDEKVLGHMIIVAKKISNILRNITGATGINIIMNNGEDAGQDVFHAHIHVVPRHHEDGVFQSPKHTEYEEGEELELALKIKNALKD